MTTRSDERWHQLQRLLDELLDLPAEEQQARLASQPDLDAELRAEAARLLGASDRVANFLNQPAAELAAPLVRAAGLRTSGRAEGQRIGPYRIIREIGRGGMGAVYLAERADEQFRQRAAIKLLPYEARTEMSLRRFLEERQILATMEHPAIARLRDGGMTDDGLPYFVMEYIDGVPIDQYADEHRLTIDERLRLFCIVCDAVQYAHGKLVVHRDIKPSNILVTPNGDVRLLDFGIAKLLSSDPALAATTTGVRIMTPEYASPEQVRGEPVTTASDVYSLGVLLYRLLTGRRPYHITGHSHAEIERAILEEEPRPPSAVIRERDTTPSPVDVAAARRTTPDRLHRSLAGDLDVIVLRALEKELDRRYGSVEQLSGDVRRYLDGRPVVARKDSLGYRVRKFVRRNRTVAAAFAVAVFALVAGTVTAVWQARRAIAQARIASAERDRARREEAKARETSKFLFEIFRSANPVESGPTPLTARDLLDRGAERIEHELTTPSDIRAGVRHEIGMAYHNLAQSREAVQQLERALADRVLLHGYHYPDVALTLIDLGLALWADGKADSATKLLRPAVSMSREFFGNHDEHTATALNNLALALQTLARYAEARTLHQEALAIRLVLHDSSGASVSLVNLGWMQQSGGRLDSAETLFQSAVQIRRRIYRADDPRTTSAVSSLAEILRREGKYDAAEPLYHEALSHTQKLYGPRGGSVGDELQGLADVMIHKRQYRAGDSLYREALAIARTNFGDQDARTALVMNNYAGSLAERGRYREALRWYEAGLGAYRAHYGPTHPFTGIVLGNVANTHHLLGDAHKADTLYRAAIEIMRAKWGDDNTSTVNATVSHGLVLVSLGRHREAEAELRPALERAVHGYPAGHWRIALAENALGSALSAQRKFDEADTLLLDGLRKLAATRGIDALETRLARQRVIAHYQRWRRPELAVRYKSEIP